MCETESKAEMKMRNMIEQDDFAFVLLRIKGERMSSKNVKDGGDLIGGVNRLEPECFVSDKIALLQRETPKWLLQFAYYIHVFLGEVEIEGMRVRVERIYYVNGNACV
ncbi:hypothetical protein VNO77_03355 [Canavalia gladiata]|uniref:Uncharacterized protein n=1 Tax=Canavalia gladiata TaxID=3824 RepID=A0AAN9MUL2_CANGL